MAREFSRHLYKSKAWEEIRDYIYIRDHKQCIECGKPGEEVHHIIWLSPDNINDESITLGEENLILLCRDCHIAKHRKKETTREGLVFNDEGELIKVY